MEIKKWNNVKLNSYPLIAFQGISEDNFIQSRFTAQKNNPNQPKNSVTDQFRFNLDAPLATSPKWIRNHRNKTMDIVVQDENNVLYLFSNTGDLFWKKQLSGPVIGEIEQVDLYKNRRLQMAFRTPDRFIILDRNGKIVSPFNFKLPSDMPQYLSIFDYDEIYDDFGKERSEYNIIKFLISDSLNPNSIQRNISMVRENIRTTRDALPYETWEYVNELYHFTNEHAHNSHNRKNRYLFLDQVISRCEQINGMLGMNLSRDHAHRFLSLGRLIERADMATRIIDITTRFENHIKNQGSNSLLEQHLWTCLLKAISCFSSYRQYVGPEIENHQAINFIFKECFKRLVKLINLRKNLDKFYF